jgi:hypothetical protein
MQKMSNFGCGEGVTEYLLTYFKLTKDWLLRTNSIPEFQKGWRAKQWTTVCLSHHERNVTQPYKDQYVNVYQKAR